MTEQAALPVAESPPCEHCGHVRGLHGRNHGCISSFADGQTGNACQCPGFVPPVRPGEDGAR